jgi:hypothetical protein
MTVAHAVGGWCLAALSPHKSRFVVLLPIKKILFTNRHKSKLQIAFWRFHSRFVRRTNRVLCFYSRQIKTENRVFWRLCSQTNRGFTVYSDTGLDVLRCQGDCFGCDWISFGRPRKQLISLPLGRPRKQLISLPLGRPRKQLISLPLGRPRKQPISLPPGRPRKQLISLPPGRPRKQPISLPLGRLMPG